METQRYKNQSSRGGRGFIRQHDGHVFPESLAQRKSNITGWYMDVIEATRRQHCGVFASAEDLLQSALDEVMYDRGRLSLSEAQERPPSNCTIECETRVDGQPYSRSFVFEELRQFRAQQLDKSMVASEGRSPELERGVAWASANAASLRLA
jgi:hypothetical protein